MIPEFIADAPEQVADMLARMWPVDVRHYPAGIHAALMETIHIAALGTALAVLLIVAGVAVTRGRALGRKLSIAHALATLALVVVGQIVTALLLYPALLELAANGGAAERGGAVGGIAGGLLGSAVALVLPAIELVVMSRPQVKEQLSQ